MKYLFILFLLFAFTHKTIAQRDTVVDYFSEFDFGPNLEVQEELQLYYPEYKNKKVKEVRQYFVWSDKVGTNKKKNLWRLEKFDKDGYKVYDERFVLDTPGFVLKDKSVYDYIIKNGESYKVNQTLTGPFVDLPGYLGRSKFRIYPNKKITVIIDKKPINESIWLTKIGVDSKKDTIFKLQASYNQKFNNHEILKWYTNVELLEKQLPLYDIGLRDEQDEQYLKNLFFSLGGFIEVDSLNRLCTFRYENRGLEFDEMFHYYFYENEKLKYELKKQSPQVRLKDHFSSSYSPYFKINHYKDGLIKTTTFQWFSPPLGDESLIGSYEDESFYISYKSMKKRQNGFKLNNDYFRSACGIMKLIWEQTQEFKKEDFCYIIYEYKFYD